MPTTVERKSSPRTGRNFNFWLDQDVADAVESFLSAQELRPDYTRFFYAAVIAYLKTKGYWPPPKKDES